MVVVKQPSQTLCSLYTRITNPHTISRPESLVCVSLLRDLLSLAAKTQPVWRSQSWEKGRQSRPVLEPSLYSNTFSRPVTFLTAIDIPFTSLSCHYIALNQFNPSSRVQMCVPGVRLYEPEHKKEGQKQKRNCEFSIKRKQSSSY